jgi:hypothetical protein
LKNSSTDNPIIEPSWTVTNASKATTTGIDLHPSKPFLATTHGQRVFPAPMSDDEDDRMEIQDESSYLQSTKNFDNSLKLWKL